MVNAETCRAVVPTQAGVIAHALVLVPLPCRCWIGLVREVLTVTHLLDMKSRETSCMVQSGDIPRVFLTDM